MRATGSSKRWRRWRRSSSDGLRRLGEHPLVGEARGLGLVGGLELVADKRTKRSFDPKRGVGARCVAFAQAEGLIVRSLAGDTLSLCPPLVIIAAHEIDELFERLTRALDRTLDWAKAQGLLGSFVRPREIARSYAAA